MDAIPMDSTNPILLRLVYSKQLRCALDRYRFQQIFGSVRASRQAPLAPIRILRLLDSWLPLQRLEQASPVPDRQLQDSVNSNVHSSDLQPSQILRWTTAWIQMPRLELCNHTSALISHFDFRTSSQALQTRM